MISTEEQKELDEELLRECEGYHEDEDKPDGAYIKEGRCFFNINKIKRLIEAGADVDSKDDEDWSPLDWAVAMDNVEIAELLISAGADVNSKGYLGRSLLHWASSEKMKSLLKKHGAI